MEQKVTVITVVRNAAKALETTIQSVLGQSVPGVDFIIIDGASTDETLQVIRRNEKSIKVWVSEADRGVYDAMNKGWSLADPDSRVLFLGAGDRLISLPEGLGAKHEPSAILFGKVCLADNQQFHARKGFWLKLYNSLHHQALLIPRSLHPEPPFCLDYPLYADFDFNQRLFKQGAIFQFDPDLQAYAAPGGLTKELDIDELAAVTRKNFGCLWSGLARVGFLLSKHFTPLRRLRPIR